MNVYAVWEGQYSDREVLGVFSSEELAQKYVAMLGDKADDARIKAYVLDVEAERGPMWEVAMEYETGNVSWVDVASYADSESMSITERGGVWAYIHAESAEHAIKIVNEKRIQHKALTCR